MYGPSSYGTIGGPVPLPPPAPTADVKQAEAIVSSRSVDEYKQAFMTEEDVRRILEEYLKKKPFASSSSVKKMDIKAIESSVIHFYSLGSTSEARSTQWMLVPYVPGMEVDGREYGPMPDAWDLDIAPNCYFMRHMAERIVPHSSLVETCQKCNGVGIVTCDWCHGRGWRSSTDSLDSSETCTWCNGSGKRTCDMCLGHCYVKFFIMMRSFFTVWQSCSLSDCKGLPEKKAMKAAKRLLFQETEPMVSPLTSADVKDEKIVADSADMINAHVQQGQQSGRMVMQRHELSAVPVHVVHCTNHGKKSSFMIYGEDNQVYFERSSSKQCSVA